jgi:prevent-host-death family protein
MNSIGLRELRQQTSDLVRQAEAGDTIVVTVSTRPVAQLGPLRPNPWRRLADVTDLFAGPADRDWFDDRDSIDGNPWRSFFS